MLAFDVITIFPGFFDGPFEHGIIRRARERGLIRTATHDLRAYTADRHRTVDDRPFGGGEGMVLKPEPIFDAVEAAREAEAGVVEVVVLSAAGRLFAQAEALRLSRADQVVLVCGRYEGIDERVVEHLATAEISIGNYVVSGGEIAAAVIVDAVTRYVPGAVGKEESILKDSFSDPGAVAQSVEHPHYTRPAQYRGVSGTRGADVRRSHGGRGMAASRFAREDVEKQAGPVERRFAGRRKRASKEKRIPRITRLILSREVRW